MTIRDQLNQRIVPTYKVMLFCFVVFIASGLIVPAGAWLLLLASVSFIGLSACLVFLHVGIRCPRCRHRIAALIYLPDGGYFRLSKAIQYCPFCGVSMDTDMEHDGQPVAPADAPQAARR